MKALLKSGKWTVRAAIERGSWTESAVKMEKWTDSSVKMWKWTKSTVKRGLHTTFRVISKEGNKLKYKRLWSTFCDMIYNRNQHAKSQINKTFMFVVIYI